MVLIAGADEEGTVKTVHAENDDNAISEDQKTVVVIHLNYVWDNRALKWVRMAQWAPL